MDDKIKAVLESYDARMRDEEKTTRAPPATGDGDWRDKSCSRSDRTPAG
jgi:hypothetical protein